MFETIHAMQTRSKAASRAVASAAHLARTLKDVEDCWAKVSAEWDASPDSEALGKLIEERVIPQETMFIDSALCLGLGSLELHPEKYTQWPDEDADEFIAYDLYRSTRRLRQLIVFETILNCLREDHFPNFPS